jgi:hypothetical protein
MPCSERESERAINIYRERERERGKRERERKEREREREREIFESTERYTYFEYCKIFFLEKRKRKQKRKETYGKQRFPGEKVTAVDLVY